MTGKVDWIGVRPERKGAVKTVDSVLIDKENGLEGDHPTQAHRQVTIISKEQLEEVRQNLNKDSIDPAAARRNIVISGFSFDDLNDQTLQIGSAEIEITGYCHPCQRMNENLGEGGRSAMSGKAGYTAKVIKSGKVKLGDEVKSANI